MTGSRHREQRLRQSRTAWRGAAVMAIGVLLLPASAFLGCGAPGRASPPSSQEKSKPAALFEETATEGGLHYRWEIPGSRPLNILQTIGN
ncbi:MAG: hypothetical protein JWN14_4052, partial [Chthonomonadales bacterium]|nr:hypothetical protein [Chthonomonadales bacterium]